VVSLASACAPAATDAGQEVVVIGADLELSGDGAALGAIYRNALELRVDQINRQGALPGRQLQLVVRDNRTDSATSAVNIADLAADPSVAAIITGGCVPCLLASVDVINAAGVPTIALAGADAVANPVSEREHIFKLGPNADDTAAALIQELIRAGVRTLALVTTDDDYGSDGRQQIIDRVARAGIEVVVDARLDDDLSDLPAVAEAVAGYVPEPVNPFAPPTEAPSGPDGVLAWGFTPFAGQVAASLRGAGYGGALYLDPGAADELFLSTATDTALTGASMIFIETMVIDEVIATSPAKAARKNWFNDYSARYGTYHGFASFGADAVQLVVSAINQVDSTDRALIRAALETSQIDGLSGPLRMTPENHSGLLPQALTTLVARGDRWRLAG
jgi:branched-chain amino acid transport system substrate-binding protein